MNKYLTLGLIIALPLIALAIVYYYSDQGKYNRLQYKLRQHRQAAEYASGKLDNQIIFKFINPDFNELLRSGYIKYYYQEFDNSTVSAEHNNFWKLSNEIIGLRSPMRFFSRSGITYDTAIAMTGSEMPPKTESPIYIHFIAKEPEYSQLKAILDSTMTPSKTQSVEKPELLGRPHSYWVSLGPHTENNNIHSDE